MVRNRMPGGVGGRREQSRLLPDSAISALMAESSYGYVQPTEFSFGSISEYSLSENQSRRSAAIQRIAELMKLNHWSEKQPN